VLGSLPPYALAAPEFRFPALAALAGRRPLGGEREVVLAVFVCVHIVIGALPGSGISAESRARRAAGARAWLAAVALPAGARAPFARLIDAAAQDEAPTLRQALRTVLDTIGRTLDAPSRREVERLEAELTGGQTRRVEN
jgi:hypothetical protein